MEQHGGYDAHPLLPLNNGRGRPRSLSEESTQDTVSDSRVNSRSPPYSNGHGHSESQQWSQASDFNRQVFTTLVDVQQNSRNRNASPVQAPVPSHLNLNHRQTQRESNGATADTLDLVNANRSIRIVEPVDPDKSLQNEDTFTLRRRRIGTYFDEAPVEKRHVQKYFFRRPRALQAEHQGHVLDIGETGKLDVEHPEMHYATSHGDKKDASGKIHHSDSMKRQRERLDLFIDLLFIGCVSNVSENYFEQAFVEETQIAKAVGDFILLFLPAWRIWWILQRFLNSYFMDDLLQRLLVLWVLVLAMVWGNNAPYFVGDLEHNLDGSNFLIISYLIASGSVGAVEMIYSVWIPWLRRMFLVALMISIPSIVLWVFATISVNPDHKVWFLLAAILYDAFEEFFMASPIADTLLGNHIRKSSDIKHTMIRYESFMIICLGEGVFLLIRDSPLGQGLSTQLGRGIQALLIYFYLCWTYFHGDLSKQYIHALYRRWWIKYLWNLLHVPMFATLVMLSSGILHLVQFEQDQLINSASEQSPPAVSERQEPSTGSSQPKYDHYTFRVATITVCIDVANIMFCQLILSLLNRSLDSKKDLLIGNQWVRMIPRALGIVALSVVWIPEYNDPSEPLGVVLFIIFMVVMWEYVAGMDRHSKLFEPKDAYSLTPSVSAQSEGP